MQRQSLQVSIAALLAVVAVLALNLWLFRFGTLAGILGLSVTKHVAIAWLCQWLGVDRRPQESLPAAPAAAGPHIILSSRPTR